MSIDNTIDFKDHIVEYPNRFKQTMISPGVVELVPTWIENPAEIIEPGTPVDSELFKKLKQNVTIYQQTLTATEGQTVINLARSYLVGQNRVSLSIGGVKQYSGQDYVETNSNTLTMQRPLKSGYKVEIIMFTASQALAEDFFEEAIAAVEATQLANEAAESAIEAANEARSAALNWRNPVDTYSQLASVSNTKTRDTIMTRDTGKVYRYNGTLWQEIQDINPTAINEVDDRLTSQISENTKRMKSHEVRFTAHRGLNNAYPENTLLAFEMACLAGYKVIELDIQPSADGVLMVHHDLTLERMTNGAGQVSAQTLSQLKTLTIDGGIAANEYPNIKIPTLEETLALFRRYNVKPMIEFKLINDYAQLNTLVNLLKAYGMEYNSSIISSVTYLIREFRARGGKSECLYLNSVTPESTALLKEYENCGYCLNYLSTTESLVKAIHSENLSVAVYTVNDVSVARNLSRWGVEYITTDTIRGVY